MDPRGTGEKQQAFVIIRGTPRRLLGSLNADGPDPTGATVTMMCAPADSVRGMAAFLPANCFCGREEQLPGIEGAKIVAKNLHLAERKTLSMQLEMQMSVSFEKRFETFMDNYVKSKFPTLGKRAVVTERRIFVSAHNSWTRTSADIPVSMSAPDDAGNSRALVIAMLPDFIVHPHVALVFTLCYSIQLAKNEIIDFVIGSLHYLPQLSPSGVDLQEEQPIDAEFDLGPGVDLFGHLLWNPSVASTESYFIKLKGFLTTRPAEGLTAPALTTTYAAGLPAKSPA